MEKFYLADEEENAGCWGCAACAACVACLACI